MQNKLVYTVDEVLQLIPITRTGLYRAISNQEIQSFRPSRRRLFTHESVQKFIALWQKKGGGHV